MSALREWEQSRWEQSRGLKGLGETPSSFYLTELSQSYFNIKADKAFGAD